MTTETNAPSADEFVANTTEAYDVDDRPQQTSSLVGSGWQAAEAMSPQTSEGFPNEFKHSEQPQVVKFIDQDGPFATFKMHFISGKPGKKSYICLNTAGATNCPLCVVLHNKAEDKRAFTVINFSAEGGPEKQILVATPRFYKSLHLAHFSPQGPLTKNYWAISRTGKMQSTVYHMQAIKPRDLQEDWNIDGEKADALVSTATSFEPKLYRENSYAELLEIAQEMMGDN